MLLTIEDQDLCLKEWEENPLKWHESLFDNILWAKQKEVLESIRDNKKTAVKSGNTCGKTYIAAEAAVHFLLTHHPSKVVTTAPTFLQVEEILWKEIAGLVHRSKMPIDCELLKTELKFSDDWFAIGISTNEVNRFQGIHSPYLLVIIDEALGVAPEIWEAIEGLHPYRVLAIGNPLESAGNFYNCFSSPLWHKITISCEDCVQWQRDNQVIPGLVTQEWIDERVDEWGRGSALFQARVLGEFPTESPDTLISRAWVERARRGQDIDSKPLEAENEEDVVRLNASDVATKHGACETVVGYRYGHTIIDLKGFKNISLTETKDKLIWLYNKKQTSSPVVDADGVGEGLPELLATERVPCIEFRGGYGQHAIDDNRFKNLRSQFYWIVAKKFEKGLYNLKHLPEKEYELLKNQLCSLKVKPPDPRGRIRIETKEDLMARGIRSPDYADTFVLLEYGFYMAKYAEIKAYKYR